MPAITFESRGHFIAWPFFAVFGMVSVALSPLVVHEWLPKLTGKRREN